MSNSKGRVFLKVCGILMIIGGAITIIVSGILGLVGYAAGNAIASAGDQSAGEVVGVLVLVGAIISLISGILELIAGIVGVKNANKPEKATTCLVWGIIVLVLNIIGMILTFVGDSSGAGTIIVSIITSLVVPVLYIVGAVLNKKTA